MASARSGVPFLTLFTIFFPVPADADDEAVSSPSGAFRVTIRAKESDPAGLDWTSTVTLLRSAPDRVVWTRTETGPRYPFRAWVSDDGRAVLRMRGEQLRVLDETGNPTLTLDLLKDALSKEEQDRYVVRADHGTFWAENSRWSIASVEGRLLFCIRPWWDRRIVVDLDRSRLVTPEPALAGLLDEEDRRYALAELKEALAALERLDPKAEHDQWCPIGGRLRRAAYLAGKLKAKEALPLLAKLEPFSYSESWIGGGLAVDDLKEGDIDPFSRSELELRRIAQLSIRRAGGRPQGLDGLSFRVMGKDGIAVVYIPLKHSTPRTARVDEVVRGMTSRQVLDALGAPDQVLIREEKVCWEFDIDEAKPYTFRVVYEGLRVDRVDKVTPAAWERDETRDRSILR